MKREMTGIRGVVVAELFGPDGDLLARCETHNLVTAVGDQFYAGRAVLSAGLPAQVTGFKLGTGSTAPAKTGAGAALAAYLAGSNRAPDAGYPTAVGGVATWRRTFGPGEATSEDPVTEAVLVTDAIASDATSAAAATICRALIEGIASKGAEDTLVVTWAHELVGA